MRPSRRQTLAMMGAAVAPALCGGRGAARSPAFRLGLTPVFLDNDAVVIEALGRALEEMLSMPVEMEQRRTYKEVTEMLLEGALEAAWLCGFPYLQHKDRLAVVGVPLWNGQPLYRSYLIVSKDDPARELADLEGDVHAFSDPDSNSGYLVTASDLARMGRRPEEFFARTIFTYGHRNVVRAVSSGLVRSGSVDGYVWEVLNNREPQMTARTKVIYRSEWLGFPPVCARADRLGEPQIQAFRQAILHFASTPDGRKALELLQLDGMTEAPPSLFDGIERRMRLLAGI
ncbi:MAG: phosphonate ABC transporter substrate-binding protein [Alphaproteobacteria bacterium]|nr:MAG: phosphonate ABC transporter substrate-binding protein [Alphaproteobacteria bacterium]